MNISEFLEEVAAEETGSKQVDIAQIRQLVKIINKKIGGILYAVIKLLIVPVLIMGLRNQSKANPLSDMIHATLIDHVELAIQFDDKGNQRLSLLDSILRIGNYNGYPLLHGQIGFSGDTVPPPGQKPNWIAGWFLRLDPFFKSVSVPAHWEFLKRLEFGTGWHYDFETKDKFANITVGLAFDPSPKP